ncbi:methionyl-tRNA formyltransferase [Thioalbus denitrificans]|uniref:Methionyl-tRNA formyltransferase n=1 Tax=Thioalbus denitrificans TaxID=547122 RepID=A0A369CII3_9GAMM|nr:methionyl-tRNA formyltransferase [Thioalbus denitrificans]RCX32895.1 methionyl-tRNA formyltransferase [Thioalbus denitrificans]
MRIIFAGTPEFAATCLQALLESPHEVCAVYTQPDRPAGRGRKLTASPVKALALEQGLAVRQPPTLRDPDAQRELAAWRADIMVVVAYGLILPQAVLDTPRLGCINVHASLLPRWRGAAPIQRAILAGDAESGVTIMQMEAGLDTGPMLLRVSCPIGAGDTAQTLHDRLANLGARALVEALAGLEAGALAAETQDEALANYAAKLEKSEAEIDWSRSAAELDRQVRAFNPWPVAFTRLGDQNLRIWEAEPRPGPSRAAPGTVVAADRNGIDVATGAGILRLKRLQLPGGRSLPARDFLNAQRGFAPGLRLGAEATPAG